jgi:hypothetical protein
MTLTKQIKLNIKLNKKLNKQIDLITNTEYLNRQYAIEYLLEQLQDIYRDELSFQQELNEAK